MEDADIFKEDEIENDAANSPPPAAADQSMMDDSDVGTFIWNFPFSRLVRYVLNPGPPLDRIAYAASNVVICLAKVVL